MLTTYPGTIMGIEKDCSWIKPKRGGKIKGPKVAGLKLGDEVQYTINGNKGQIVSIEKIGTKKIEREERWWEDHTWNIDYEFYIPI